MQQTNAGKQPVKASAAAAEQQYNNVTRDAAVGTVAAAQQDRTI